MTETLTIDRIAVTSPDDGHGWAERVNRIVDRVAGVRLDQTLRSRPLAAEGEWLIRHVAVSATLDLPAARRVAGGRAVGGGARRNRRCGRQRG